MDGEQIKQLAETAEATRRAWHAAENELAAAKVRHAAARKAALVAATQLTKAEFEMERALATTAQQ